MLYFQYALIAKKDYEIDMIQVKFEKEAFYVKGSLNLGYIGIFENTTWLKDAEIAKDKTEDNLELAVFGKAHIVIVDSLEAIETSIKNDEHWAMLKEYSPCNSPSEIASALEKYYNSFEEKIEQNLKEFNDTFLYFALEFFDLINTNFMNFRKRLGMYFIDTPCDGTVEKPDLERYIRYGFAEKQEMGQRIMLDKILAHIQADILTLADADMAFQCHDTIIPESLYLKSAYAEIDYNLQFNNWNN